MVDAALPRLAIQFPLLNMMARAAAKASRKLVRDFGEVEQLQVSKKALATLCRRLICARKRPLKKSF